MPSQVDAGRHRRLNSEDRQAVAIEGGQVEVILNGPRRQAREAVRRATRRSVGFAIIATASLVQSGLSAVLGLWSGYGAWVRVAFAALAAFMWAATVFLTCEMFSAMKTMEENSGAQNDLDSEHVGGDIALRGV